MYGRRIIFACNQIHILNIKWKGNFYPLLNPLIVHSLRLNGLHEIGKSSKKSYGWRIMFVLNKIHELYENIIMFPVVHPMIVYPFRHNGLNELVLLKR